MCYQSFLTSSRQNIIVYTLKQNKKYFLRFQKLNAFVVVEKYQSWKFTILQNVDTAIYL